GAHDRDSPRGERDEDGRFETADRLPRQAKKGLGEFERCSERQQGNARDQRQASHGIVGPDRKQVPRSLSLVPRSLPPAARQGWQGTPAAYAMSSLPANAREGWPGLRWTKDRFETRNCDMRS